MVEIEKRIEREEDHKEEAVTRKTEVFENFEIVN
jgi:hypothetical protein